MCHWVTTTGQPPTLTILYLHLHKWYWNASVAHHSTYSGCLMCDSTTCAVKLCWWLSGCRSSAVEKHLQLKLGALGIQGGCYFPLILSHNMFCFCSWMVVPECQKLHTVYANYLICLVINDSNVFVPQTHWITNDLIGCFILLSRELETSTRCTHYEQRDLPMQGNPSLIPRPHAAWNGPVVIRAIVKKRKH